MSDAELALCAVTGVAIAPVFVAGHELTFGVTG